MKLLKLFLSVSFFAALFAFSSTVSAQNVPASSDVKVKTPSTRSANTEVAPKAEPMTKTVVKTQKNQPVSVKPATATRTKQVPEKTPASVPAKANPKPEQPSSK